MLIQHQPDAVHRLSIRLTAKQGAIRLAPRCITRTQGQIHLVRLQLRVELVRPRFQATGAVTGEAVVRRIFHQRRPYRIDLDIAHAGEQEAGGMDQG